MKDQSLQEQDIVHNLAPLNRRGFLKAGLAASLTAGSLLTWGCSADIPTNAALNHMTASQQQLFQRLVDLLLPQTTNKLTPATQIPVLANINTLFGMLDPSVHNDLSMAIGLFDYGSLVLGGHFRRFGKLDDAAALSYIESWQGGNSIQRGVVSTLKKLVYASYWRDETTWGPLDFDGPVSERWGLPSLGNAPLPMGENV